MTRPSRATTAAVARSVAVVRVLAVAHVAPDVGVHVNAGGGTRASNVAVAVPKDGYFLLPADMSGESEKPC